MSDSSLLTHPIKYSALRFSRSWNGILGCRAKPRIVAKARVAWLDSCRRGRNGISRTWMVFRIFRDYQLFNNHLCWCENDESVHTPHSRGTPQVRHSIKIKPEMFHCSNESRNTLKAIGYRFFHLICAGFSVTASFFYIVSSVSCKPGSVPCHN